MLTRQGTKKAIFIGGEKKMRHQAGKLLWPEILKGRISMSAKDTKCLLSGEA